MAARVQVLPESCQPAMPMRLPRNSSKRVSLLSAAVTTQRWRKPRMMKFGLPKTPVSPQARPVV